MEKIINVTEAFSEIPTFLGAIIGDVIGSAYEYPYEVRTRDKNFELFTPKSKFTDDTVLTVAIAQSFLETQDEPALLSERVDYNLKKFRNTYRNRGYGPGFRKWCKGETGNSSLGNGSSMRVSSVAYVAKSEAEVLKLAEQVSVVSHAHPDGISAAQGTALAIFLALHHTPKQHIKIKVSQVMNGSDLNDPNIYNDQYGDSVATSYPSVPQAISCFFSAYSVEEAIRTAVACGQDADTQADIAGAIACPFYKQISLALVEGMVGLPEKFIEIISNFSRIYQVPHMKII